MVVGDVRIAATTPRRTCGPPVRSWPRGTGQPRGSGTRDGCDARRRQSVSGAPARARARAVPARVSEGAERPGTDEPWRRAEHGHDGPGEDGTWRSWEATSRCPQVRASVHHLGRGAARLSKAPGARAEPARCRLRPLASGPHGGRPAGRLRPGEGLVSVEAAARQGHECSPHRAAGADLDPGAAGWRWPIPDLLARRACRRRAGHGTTARAWGGPCWAVGWWAKPGHPTGGLVRLLGDSTRPDLLERRPVAWACWAWSSP
ncbi:hypothetical protein QJS66_15890 [Kocuria rhizophila]|nr:hypothetical protein QJS66_15890 [Kocuria rhizophila]